MQGNSERFAALLALIAAPSFATLANWLKSASSTSREQQEGESVGDAPAAVWSVPLPPGAEEELIGLFSPHNLLVRLLSFVRLKMHSIHSTCVLCEKELPFPALNLSICSSALCTLSYEEMGVGFDVASAIVAAPLLIDLYLSMFASAVAARHLPFARPTNVTAVTSRSSGAQTRTFLDAAGDIDFALLDATLSLIPAVDELVALIRRGRERFVQVMNALDVLIIPLLRWLFISCPTYIRPLAQEERFANMVTPHQFVLLMSSPEKEHRFQQLKAEAKAPSIWAFHGTSPPVAENRGAHLRPTSFAWLTCGAALLCAVQEDRARTGIRMRITSLSVALAAFLNRCVTSQPLTPHIFCCDLCVQHPEDGPEEPQQHQAHGASADPTSSRSASLRSSTRKSISTHSRALLPCSASLVW